MIVQLIAENNQRRTLPSSTVQTIRRYMGPYDKNTLSFRRAEELLDEIERTKDGRIVAAGNSFLVCAPGLNVRFSVCEEGLDFQEF